MDKSKYKMSFYHFDEWYDIKLRNDRAKILSFLRLALLSKKVEKFSVEALSIIQYIPSA